MSKNTIHIEGMGCEHCVKAVSTALLGCAGVENAVVSLEKNAADVEYDENKVSLNELKQAIRDAGYDTD
ncbi:MAG: copper ion binding protein [Erysipelotrichaceae bacterium]|nr:copper ion binding protein [Erysipelotrichaceae bacterium]